jgi:hypothetical protein
MVFHLSKVDSEIIIIIDSVILTTNNDGKKMKNDVNIRNNN